jgi:hypothetical protein
LSFPEGQKPGFAQRQGIDIHICQVREGASDELEALVQAIDISTDI